MARIRSLHPGQWTDEQFVSCSYPARLLALGIRNIADDFGAFEWKPLQIKMQLFPADNVDIPELLQELVNTDQVIPYAVDGKSYGQIRNFTKFQSPQKPKARCPRPPEYETGQIPMSDSGTGQVQDRSEKTVSEGIGEGIGKGIGDSNLSSSGDSSPASARLPKAEPLPAAAADEKPKSEFIVVAERVLDLCGIDPAKCTWNFHEAQTWLNAGYKPDKDIYPTVEDVVRRNRAKDPDWKPKGLRYFTGAIEEAFKTNSFDIPPAMRRGNGSSETYEIPAPENLTDKQWAARCERRRKTGEWFPEAWGPDIGEPGCLVPDHVLAEHQRAIDETPPEEGVKPE